MIYVCAQEKRESEWVLNLLFHWQVLLSFYDKFGLKYLELASWIHFTWIHFNNTFNLRMNSENWLAMNILVTLQ